MAIGDAFEEVLAGAQHGDPSAFDALYRDLAPLVIGYLRANGAREAEDLASEVFVAVVRGIASFTGGEDAFRSWVLTIAHRRLVDEMRRRSRRPEDPVDPDALTARAVPAPSTAETEVMELASVSAVSDALARLTDDQRAVITLRILAEVPIKEVAAILGKPETAVKSLQHRALASLARNLMRDLRGELEPGPRTGLPSSIQSDLGSDH